jgi:hypothetical protein
MNEDNQVAIKMINNNQITKRSKHIDISCHFVRERFENQDIKIRYYHIDKIAAGGCTKGLAVTKFNTFIKLLSLRVLKEEFEYQVKASALQSSSSLGSTRRPLFPASSILGIP